MNFVAKEQSSFSTALSQAINEACTVIAPMWPLDKMIAVNPYWGRISKPFPRVAHILKKVAASPMTMDGGYYSNLWQREMIKPHHLALAQHELSEQFTVDELLASLSDQQPTLFFPPLICDILDCQKNLQHEPSWQHTITHQVSQFCAAFFDQGQADWFPSTQAGLYTSWREVLISDRSVSLLMQAPFVPEKAKLLEENADTQIQNALIQLEVPEHEWSLFLQAVLMRISGWSAWCAYHNWQANLKQRSDSRLIDLLAIRLSWECLLDDGQRDTDSHFVRWKKHWIAHWKNETCVQTDKFLIWQRAHEISEQEKLSALLAKPVAAQETTQPLAQCVFCIDVRSEIFRRHLEAQNPEIETLGFAGFFGVPIEYQPIGTDMKYPQLPGLISPSVDVTDSTFDPKTDEEIIDNRRNRLEQAGRWQIAQSMPASTFTLVETCGLSYMIKLFRQAMPRIRPFKNLDQVGLTAKQSSQLEPVVVDSNQQINDCSSQQIEMVRNALVGMGLTTNFAPLVFLIGHGSQTTNNPQQAGLHCGACGGQTGEVNAKLLARLLNQKEVRLQLINHSIDIPENTVFLAALHNTTTDEIQVYETLNTTFMLTQEALQSMLTYFEQAGHAARQERALSVNLQHLVYNEKALKKAFQVKATDWSETRPEWGLIKNSAFIIGPRSVTKQVNLEGRAFLHNYAANNDKTGEVLEQIMTAPMIVTHWINMQYFASTVDNKRYGSGNKTLHNVVGGSVGLFEGNDGDLRHGLALQSLHDGSSWQHSPIRLSVYIVAPRVVIGHIIAKHALLSRLVNNAWLYVFQLDENTGKIYKYLNGRWDNQLVGE